ncbi:N-acetylmuramoyl-L-alanine amidase [candidate division FCPU426 bacterium]|nr:N-acetylmuramoyl-L-alanine amidase [candidate division FCPU426 bacterium]
MQRGSFPRKSREAQKQKQHHGSYPWRCVALGVLLLSAGAGSLSAEETPEKAALPPPLQVVVIDPGHGGKDGGMLVAKNRLEKDVVLAAALALKEELGRQANLQLYLTRTRDIAVTILERTTMANRQETDIFISLHLTTQTQTGGQVRIYINQTRELERPAGLQFSKMQASAYITPWYLAQNGQQGLSEQLAAVLLKSWREPDAVSGESELYQAPLVTPLSVLTGVRAPAVLVELPLPAGQALDDRRFEETIRIMSRRLARGLVQFLTHR